MGAEERATTKGQNEKNQQVKREMAGDAADEQAARTNVEKGQGGRNNKLKPSDGEEMGFKSNYQ